MIQIIIIFGNLYTKMCLKRKINPPYMKTFTRKSTFEDTIKHNGIYYKPTKLMKLM